MRKQTGCLLLLLAVLLAPCAALAEKYDRLPPIFEVSVRTEDRREGDNERYIYKEYLQTTNERVNDALRDTVDALDAQLSPLLPPDPDNNAKRNCRLDIGTIYYRTGQSWLSTLVFARTTLKRAQQSCHIQSAVYDLETGERIGLRDVFPEESAAWALLAQRVREHLCALFADEAPDEAAVDALCAREALENADFTLSGMELTLHYEVCAIYPGHPGLAHVRFFYPELAGMMTEAAARQTDNRAWKMVALTCDDGPNYGPSANALVNFRQYGARVTYFIVGESAEEDMDIVLREFDENHLVASHSYHHWGGATMRPESRRRDFAKHNESLVACTGEPARFFRAPGGTYEAWIEADIGVPVIQWSVDTYDYTGKSPSRIFYSVRNNAQDGDVILMHDSGAKLYDAIPLFAQWLTDNGFMMVTVEELAAAQGVTMQPNTVYYRFFEGDYQPRPDSNLN